jgi:hypothetical protein
LVLYDKQSIHPWKQLLLLHYIPPAAILTCASREEREQEVVVGVKPTDTEKSLAVDIATKSESKPAVQRKYIDNQQAPIKGRRNCRVLIVRRVSKSKVEMGKRV